MPIGVHGTRQPLSMLYGRKGGRKGRKGRKRGRKEEKKETLKENSAMTIIKKSPLKSNHKLEKGEKIYRI